MKKTTYAERFMELMAEIYPDQVAFATPFWKNLAQCATQSAISRLSLTASEKQFFSSQAAPWEMTKLEDYVVARKLLADAWAGTSGDPAVWTDVKTMWREGRFDSVAHKCITVHGITIRCGHSLEFKAESDVVSRYANEGRESLSPSRLSAPWGVGLDCNLAIRGKINGLMFNKVQRGDKFFLAGHVDIPVPANFPVEKAEYYAGKFYILVPSPCPSFVFKPNWTEPFFPSLVKLVFESHPWMHPSDFREHIMYDGIMVLTHEKEYRVKRYPTCEIPISDDGALIPWEVAMYGTDNESFRRIRARPGKPTYPNLRNLLAEVTEETLHGVFPFRKNYTVLEIVSGSIETNKSSRKRDGASVLILDSGYRFDAGMDMPMAPADIVVPRIKGVEVLQVDMENGIVHGKNKKGPFVTSVKTPTYGTVHEKSYIGSKLIVFCPDDEQVYLIRDEDKPLDFIGGKKELNESPMECLLREIEEETGVIVSSDIICYLGYSDASEEKVFARSYVYFVAVGLGHPLLRHLVPIGYEKLKVDASTKRYQAWVGRILSYFDEYVVAAGGLNKLAGSVTPIEYKIVSSGLEQAPPQPDVAIVPMTKNSPVVAAVLRGELPASMAFGPVMQGVHLITKSEMNYVGMLGEFCQSGKRPLASYASFKVAGPPHIPHFVGVCILSGKRYIAPELYSTLKTANQFAAAEALHCIRNNTASKVLCECNPHAKEPVPCQYHRPYVS